MREPSFLLIGAQKCGTTWLSEMLRQHPEVYTPERKELHFFDLKANYAKGMDWYLANFAGATRERAIGECTPNYLWVQEACPTSIPALKLEVKHHDEVNREIPRRVHEAFPDVRLIVILRNPVDRAISSYRHHIRMRRIPPRSSILEVGGQLGILSMGFYTDQLLAWEQYFSRDRFLVLIYEQDVRKEPGAALRRTFDHIGVDPGFSPTGSDARFNERSSDAFMYARHFAPRLARAAFRAFPVLNRISVPGMGVSREERETLARIYEDDVRRLESYLGIGLDRWRKSEEGPGPRPAAV